ncbi:hypothetical protein MKZ38_006941 [Zalerion maritima]|uniref:Uncharacterized protein n=1 Tax=Zalerion maritima TaxID=339359 RepID=A0AAD5RW05_9PEZI|nr:hypothetical protein MKZ38_006941 [Zalerion maritima]
MFMRKTLDVVTLFHKATSPGSLKVLATLKDAAAKATANTGVRDQFKLDVTESPPTLDQLQCIIEYMKQPKPESAVIRGANNTEEAFKKFKETPNSFQRPVVVDWTGGRAIASEDESEILKMLAASKKQ